ncbi:hypothetical protein [Deinococcus radiophilus]|uniref:Uncharacterized protein n=2 Tax=Deinococcus radiophilus TaxID=32062 RepID=A0A3S0ICH6_9DEIO|nr:hypothetical protein [Deinococcus radiophilus]RTR29422.1 hypothetical protein EJ104_03260 [Deinococcus radiophilus]UFA50749.1 hypothetical protein LMT64_02245 [Deinococcus radiophilus]
MKMNRMVTAVVALAFGTQAGALPAIPNCAAERSNPRCIANNDASAAGTIGSGPSFYQGGTRDELRGGFVTADGQKLIVAINTLSDVNDRYGAVMEVDLNTGNRRIISGYLNSTESRGKGVTTQGDRGQTELYDLGRVSDVNPLPGGDLVAYSGGQAIRINAGTGDRTLLWTSATSGDTRVRDGVERKFTAGGTAGAAAGRVAVPDVSVNTPLGNISLGGLLGGNRGNAQPAATAAPQPGNGYFCPQSTPAPRPAIPRSSIATDAQGNIYLLHDNNPLGSGLALFKLDASKDYRCTAVSQFSANGENVVGGGIPWVANTTSSGPLFGDLILAGDTVYAAGGPNPNYIVVGVNTRSGERTLVSGQRTGNGVQVFKKGNGEALIGESLAFSNNFLYTTEEQVNAVGFSPVRIDPRTGDRTALPVAKDSPLSVGWASDTQLYAIPNSNKLLVWYRRALHLYDPATGQNMILSR